LTVSGWEVAVDGAFVLLIMLMVAVLPVPLSNAQTQTISNVTYCSPGGINLQLDLYLPTSAGSHPVVVQVHAGGWTGGAKSSKETLPPVYTLLNAQGIAFVSINYRLAPAYKFPAPVQDTACAIRFLRAHATQYGIDPTKVGLWGMSAGGQITDMVALTGGGVATFGYGADNQWTGYLSNVQALVSWFGPTNVTIQSDFSAAAWSGAILPEFGAGFPAEAAGSPVYYVTANEPPVLLIHGYNDTTVSCRQSINLYNLLTSAGNTNDQLVLVQNADHSFQRLSSWPPMSPSLTQIQQMTADWFAAWLLQVGTTTTSSSSTSSTATWTTYTTTYATSTVCVTTIVTTITSTYTTTRITSNEVSGSASP
jgi:acetyl esterase/lipase